MGYTPNEIRDILKELGIAPLKVNRVDSAQAAKILTWRLKHEQDVERDYTTTAVRRRVDTGALPVAEQVNPRFNLYDVRDIFELSLMPDKAKGAKQRIFKQKENTSSLLE